MSGSSKWTGKTRVVLICAVLAAAAGSCASAPASTADLIDPSLIPAQSDYTTAAVQTGTFTSGITAAGTLIFPVSADLSFADPGTAAYVDGDGQKCRKGDVLAQIQFDPVTVNANIKVLELQIQQENDDFAAGQTQDTQALAALNGQLDTASDSLARQKLKLQIERQQRDSGYAGQQHNQRLADLNDQLAKQQSLLRPADLVAPFDGVIAVPQPIPPGSAVSAGQKILTVYDTSRYYLQIKAATSSVRYNMRVMVDLGGGQTGTGRVINEPGAANPAAAVGNYLIALDQPVDLSRASSISSSYTVTIPTVTVENAIMASNKAIVVLNSLPYVNILEDGAEKVRYVKAGYSDPVLGVTQIIAGLDPGQQVVLN